VGSVREMWELELEEEVVVDDVAVGVVVAFEPELRIEARELVRE
jgi:hypothetical protein